MTSETRVLIVEDDPRVSRLYAKIINHAGFQTRQVSTIDDGLLQVKKFDPDIVCLDWQLGDQVGEDMLAFLAGINSEERPRIVLVSGRITRNDLLAFTSFVNLIDVVLMKPVVLSELIDAVKKLSMEGANRVKRSHMAVEQAAPGVVVVTWEGRVTDDLVARLQSEAVLQDATRLVFDVRGILLSTRPHINLMQAGSWRSLKRVLVVHNPGEANSVRGTLARWFEGVEMSLFTDVKTALQAALDDSAAAKAPSAPPTAAPTNGKTSEPDPGSSPTPDS